MFSSKTPTTASTVFGTNSDEVASQPTLPKLKSQRITLKTYKREDIVLSLHEDEIKSQATGECNGEKSGFTWVHKCSELTKKKISKMSTEDLRKVDNEVQVWNDRQLPPSEQAK